MTRSTFDSFSACPADIFIQILNFFEVSDWIHFKLVSKAWRELTLEACFSKRKLSPVRGHKKLMQFWGNYFSCYIPVQSELSFVRPALHSAEGNKLFDILSFLFHAKGKTFYFSDDELRELLKTSHSLKMIRSLLPFLSNNGVEIFYTEVVKKQETEDGKFRYVKTIVHRLHDSQAEIMRWMISKDKIDRGYFSDCCSVLEKMVVFFSVDQIRSYIKELKRIIMDESVLPYQKYLNVPYFKTLLVFARRTTPMECYDLAQWAIGLVPLHNGYDANAELSSFIKGLWLLVLKPEQPKLFDQIEKIFPEASVRSELTLIIMLNSIFSLLNPDQQKRTLRLAYTVLKKMQTSRVSYSAAASMDNFSSKYFFPLLARSAEHATPEEIKFICSAFQGQYHYYPNRKHASKLILDHFDNALKKERFLNDLSASMGQAVVRMTVFSVDFDFGKIREIYYYADFFNDSQRKILVKAFLKRTEGFSAVLPDELMLVLTTCLEEAESSTIDDVLKRIFSVMQQPLTIFQCCRPLFSTFERLEMIIPYFFRNNPDDLKLFDEVIEHLYEHFDERFIQSYFEKITSYFKKVSCSFSLSGLKIFLFAASSEEKKAFLQSKDLNFRKNGFDAAVWLIANQYLDQTDLPHIEKNCSITIDWEKKILYRLAEAMQELYPVKQAQQTVECKKP